LSASVAIAAAAAALWYRSSRVLWFTYVASPLAPGEYAAFASRLGWRATELDVDDGVRLVGLERPTQDPSAPWIFFFDGNSPHQLEDGQRVLDALLSGTNWGGSTWAYRGFDGSGGTPDPASLEKDAWSIYERTLADKHLAPERTGLVGFSLGTSLVAAVGARAAPHSPAGIVLLAPVTRIDMRFRGRAASHRYETLKFLDRLTGPVLVVQGLDDKTLDPRSGVIVADRLGARARYVPNPGLDHLDLLEAPVVTQEARAFLRAQFRD
jgi:pimeloyl-ACP methyl ester carboxylesterase